MEQPRTPAHTPPDPANPPPVDQPPERDVPVYPEHDRDKSKAPRQGSAKTNVVFDENRSP